jgi:uncharacterized protein
MKPRALALETADAAAYRIAEHAKAHGLAQVSVVLHGGEPLLLGTAGMRELLAVLVARITPVARLDVRVHSNGVLLDERWCELFREYRVHVGISLDGDRSANDLHRRFANGRSSHPQVLRALALLRRSEYRLLYAGILCTVDLANDPVKVYRALVEQEPPAVDLLLPHATWERPPYRPAGQDAPYASWLMRVYRCWDDDGRRVSFRIFDSLLSGLRGGPSFTEALGTDPADLLVIDTDGAWEQPDSMKTAFDGAPTTGMNVFDHTVDQAAAHPAVASRQGGLDPLCATCQACPVVRVCGGGLYAHRFRRSAGDDGRPRGAGQGHGLAEFDNPSVYCHDLKSLIDLVSAAKRTRPRLVAVFRTPPDRAAVSAERTHRIPGRAFDLLAAGPGDIAGVRELANLRLSRTRMLVAAVATADSGPRDPALRSATEAGWALLRELDHDHRDSIQDIFAEPYVSAWAWRCLRPAPGADIDLDRAHLAGLAAAAALRADVAVDLQVPVRHGMVHVPTVGAVAAPPGSGTTCILSVRPGRGPSVLGGGRWRRVHRVTSMHFAGLAIEDLDPFRDCQGWPAAARLDPAASQRWRRGMASVGRHLAVAVPDYAQVLGYGLRAVVPLRPAVGGHRSATAREVFGGVAVALPGPHPRRGELSELVLHEFQHVKLYALLDMYQLLDPEYRGLLRVPWRTDPRPAEGALHGTYAFLALTHLRRGDGPSGRVEWLKYRAWVLAGIAELRGADGALTAAGLRFVDGMAGAAEGASA